MSPRTTTTEPLAPNGLTRADNLADAHEFEQRAVAHLDARRAFAANGFGDQAREHLLLADTCAQLAVFHHRMAKLAGGT